MTYNSHELWALVLELRDRIEALEAAQQPTIKESLTVAPAGSLVERVADAIVTKATSAGIVDDRPARAAIREVAEWLREHYGGPTASSTALEQEAER